MDDLIRVAFGVLLLLLGVHQLGWPRAHLDLHPKQSIFRRLNPLEAFYYTRAGLLLIRLNGAVLAIIGLLLLLI